jgi:hypothetical protein
VRGLAMHFWQNRLDGLQQDFGLDLAGLALVATGLVFHDGEAVLFVAAVPGLDGAPGELAGETFLIGEGHLANGFDAGNDGVAGSHVDGTQKGKGSVLDCMTFSLIDKSNGVVRIWAKKGEIMKSRTDPFPTKAWKTTACFAAFLKQPNDKERRHTVSLRTCSPKAQNKPKLLFTEIRFLIHSQIPAKLLLF